MTSEALSEACTQCGLCCDCGPSLLYLCPQVQQFFLERCGNGEWKWHWWLKSPGRAAAGSSQGTSSRPSSRSVWSASTAVAFSAHHAMSRSYWQVKGLLKSTLQSAMHLGRAVEAETHDLQGLLQAPWDPRSTCSC